MSGGAGAVREHDDRMPRATMWWGVALLVGGGALIVLAPATLNLLVTPNTESWQSAVWALDTVLSVLRVTLPPLGAALVAGSLVMRYVDRRLAGPRGDDRPRRWYFPPSAE